MERHESVGQDAKKIQIYKSALLPRIQYMTPERRRRKIMKPRGKWRCMFCTQSHYKLSYKHRHAPHPFGTKVQMLQLQLTSEQWLNCFFWKINKDCKLSKKGKSCHRSVDCSLWAAAIFTCWVYLKERKNLNVKKTISSTLTDTHQSWTCGAECRTLKHIVRTDTVRQHLTVLSIPTT